MEEPVPYKGDVFESTGVLRYSYKEGYGYKLILEVDKDIANYRKFIPKCFKVNSQMYPPHITVVRNEIPVNLDVWDKQVKEYEGEEIKFLYSNYINRGTVYWWLNAFCTRLEEIRVELGLPVSSVYTLPPEGFVRCWHITIGNSKENDG